MGNHAWQQRFFDSMEIQVSKYSFAMLDYIRLRDYLMFMKMFESGWFVWYCHYKSVTMMNFSISIYPLVLLSALLITKKTRVTIEMCGFSLQRISIINVAKFFPNQSKCLEGVRNLFPLFRLIIACSIVRHDKRSESNPYFVN